MNKLINSFLLCVILVTMPACDVLNETAGVLLEESKNEESRKKLSNQEVIAGLKEALKIGIENAVDVTSVTNGFLENNNIKLPFPESANAMKEKALEWGLDSQVQKVVTTLNRAAEDAAKEAT